MTLRRYLVLASLLVGSCAPAVESPPPTPRKPVVEELHGERIADPYRWLEQQIDPAVRDWIDAQNAYAERVLGAAATQREAFRARLAALMDRPEVGTPRRAGARELFTLRRPGEPTASIVARSAPAGGDAAEAAAGPIDPAGRYEVIVDPLALRPDGTTSVDILDVSPAGKLLAYSVRDGGRDEVEVRFRDLGTGEDLPDRLAQALYGPVHFAPGGAGVLYVHRSRSDGPRLRYHRFGTPAAEDALLFGEGVPPTAFLSMRPIAHPPALLLEVQHGWRRSDLYWLPLRQDGVTPAAPARPLVVGLDALFDVEWREGRIWARTNHEAPNWRLVTFEPTRPEPGGWQEVLAEADDPLAAYVVVGERIYATYLVDSAHAMRVFALDGTPQGQLDLPPASTASVRAHGEGRALLTIESFLTPPTTWEIDLATGERRLYQEPTVSFDGSGMVVELIDALSADGTLVPVHVVRRGQAPLDGSGRLLLHGYGGFNVALTPRFDPLAAAWLQAGGSYALAHLRGGAERGERWHRAGMLGNKQHVFDDFIAAAETLIERGYTRPQRLAIRGVSNGGLLMAAVITQRPELFRAAAIAFPDLDMLRYFTFEQTNNKPALLEYGDASDPEQFAFLRAYSPYQAVRDGVRYPAVILSSGDLDTRVPPLQARKMTARLQAASRSGRPVILRYDARAGHAGGRPIGRRIEDAAAELAFLEWQLEGG